MSFLISQPIFPFFPGSDGLGMAKSDLQLQAEGSESGTSDNMVRNAEKMALDRPQNESLIHSGHFMVSRVHDDDLEPDEDPDSSPEPEVKEEPISLEDTGAARHGYDFGKIAAKTPKPTYEFGDKKVESFGIDSSLTTLFDCMSLAYRSVDLSVQIFTPSSHWMRDALRKVIAV